MLVETPKKIVDESPKCFTCSSQCPAKERVYIFGKTAHNFAEIIKATLDIDVNGYANNDTNTKLFVCKTSCYKRLLKFQRATEKLEEVKKEIQDAFQGRPRAKRLLRPTNGDQEEISACLQSTNRAKASRTLQFSSANVSSTTCASSFASNENSPVKTQQVRLSVQYPSKKLNKTLYGSYQNVGKALAKPELALDKSSDD